MTIAGRAAIVTGAGRGIGRAVAEKLAAEGARVLATDLDGDSLEGFADNVTTLEGDLTDAAFPDALIDTAVDTLGGVDILVNNAGYVWNSAIHNHSDEQWYAMLDMHATAPFRTLRALGRWLRTDAARDPGYVRKVVNVSSVSGIFGAATQIAYSAGKAAVVGLTRTLSKEWGRFGVTVNAVAFGHIETRLTQSYGGEPPTIEVKGRAFKVGLHESQLERQKTTTPPGRRGRRHLPVLHPGVGLRQRRNSGLRRRRARLIAPEFTHRRTT